MRGHVRLRRPLQTACVRPGRLFSSASGHGEDCWDVQGSDAAKAGVLAQAAERAQCATHLGIVHIGESGAAEPDFAEYSYRSRWNRYRDYDDDEGAETEDEEDDESASFTAVTVDDSWQYVDEWRDTMTHVTERAGSPQTLVCTKDRRAFDRRMKQYGHEIAAMRALLDLAPNSDAATVLSKRMHAAVDRARGGRR